jgi:alkylhydroperoxidase family enzyme
MPRIDLPEGEPLYTWMSYRPEMAPGVAALSDAAYTKSQLPLRIREIVRFRVALSNDCTVCQRSRSAKADEGGVGEDLYEHVADWRNYDGFSDREKLAAEFAELFTTNHLAMGDEFFGRLRHHFDDGEIVDLGICCLAFLTGRLLKVLEVDDSCVLTLDQPTPVTAAASA